MVPAAKEAIIEDIYSPRVQLHFLPDGAEQRVIKHRIANNPPATNNRIAPVLVIAQNLFAEAGAV